MKAPMLPIGEDLADAFTQWALDNNLKFARANRDWFMVYDPKEYEAALNWLVVDQGVRYITHIC